MIRKSEGIKKLYTSLKPIKKLSKHYKYLIFPQIKEVVRYCRKCPFTCNTPYLLK